MVFYIALLKLVVIRSLASVKLVAIADETFMNSYDVLLKTSGHNKY